MIIDLKRCIGCDACTVACRQENGTPPNVLFARVYRREYGKYSSTKRFFLPVLCNHCEEPPCMKACPSHAIHRRDDGAVLIDEDKCCGSKACITACPYGAIFFPDEESTYFPLEVTEFERFHIENRRPQTAMKCTFCNHRIDRGMEPACVVTCPTECRIFGDLDDPEGKPSKYLRARTPKGEVTPLRPESGTRPNVLYLL